MNSKREQFTVLVAEDDLMQQRLLINYLCEINLTIIGAVRSGERLVEACKKCKPDIIVIDISLSKKDGVTACKEIILLGLRPQIIIVTSSTDRNHLLAGFELNSIAYILKPLRKNMLISAIETAMVRIREKRNMSLTSVDHSKMNWIKCKDQFKTREIAESQIIYIKKEGKYLTIIYLCDGTEIKTTSSLKEIKEQRHSTIFQSHKSFIVNLIHIKSVFASIDIMGNYDISLVKCDTIIPLSKRMYANYLKTKELLYQI